MLLWPGSDNENPCPPIFSCVRGLAAYIALFRGSHRAILARAAQCGAGRGGGSDCGAAPVDRSGLGIGKTNCSSGFRTCQRRARVGHGPTGATRACRKRCRDKRNRQCVRRNKKAAPGPRETASRERRKVSHADDACAGRDFSIGSKGRLLLCQSKLVHGIQNDSRTGEGQRVAASASPGGSRSRDRGMAGSTATWASVQLRVSLPAVWFLSARSLHRWLMNSTIRWELSWALPKTC